MPSLVYVRLITFTAGTLLQLFWMVVILGYRRQRNFERVFFFLCLALFCFYGGSLAIIRRGSFAIIRLGSLAAGKARIELLL